MQSSLRAGKPARTASATSRRGLRGRRGDAANCSTVSDSPRAPGSTPAATSAAAARSAPPAQPASAARSVLRRWANAASTTAKTALRGDVGAGRLPPGEGDQAGVDVGHRPEDARRHLARPAGRGVPGELHRRNAVDLGARAGDQPVGHLLLHHHQPAPQAGQLGQQVQHHRHRDVVRQVRHQRGRRRLGQVGGGDPQRVRGVDRSAGRPGRRRARRRSPAAPRPAPGRSRRRARAPRPPAAAPGSASRGPGPTSSTTSSGIEAGGGDDAPHGVRVVHEVLAERLGRRDARGAPASSRISAGPSSPGSPPTGPKTRSPVAESAAHSSSRSVHPLISASARTVSGIR